VTSLSFDIFARNHASKEFDRLSRDLSRTSKELSSFGDRAASSFLRTANSLSNIPTAAAALNGLTSTVGSLAGVLGLIPAAAAAAAAGFATLAVGTQGFAEGFKALADTSKIQKAAGGAADASVQAARRIEDAQASLARAHRSTRDAEEALTRAQLNSKQAQDQLTRSRERAAEQLEDLQRSLSGAALDEESAVLGVQRAQERLAEAVQDGASGLDLREASLGIRQAQQALEETRDRYADLRRESEQANKAGVEGSDEVVAAQEQVADAARGLRDAQEGVADAAENVRDAQRDVARAMEDAARSADKAGAALAGTTEAFDKLSDNAKDTVRAILGLGDAWTDMRKSVQDALFAGVADDVKLLGGTYIPVLKSGMTGVAGEFNSGARSVADFVAQGEQVNTVSSIFGGTRDVVGDLSATLRPLVSILLDVSAVGIEMLPGLTGGFGKAADSAAAFVKNARETGELRNWIQEGLDTLAKLGDLFSNIGKIFSAVFSGLNAGGAGFLDTMVRVTGAVAAFLQSAQGQEILNALGSALRAISSAVTDVLLAALEELGPVIVALAPGFAELAKIVSGVLVKAFEAWGPILVAVAGFLSDNITWLGPLALALYGVAKALQFVTLAMKALALVAAVNPWVLIIAATVALVALIITFWDEIVGAVKAAIDWIVGFVKNNWELLISIILGPLGVIIALVVNYWDEIIGAFTAAWNFIRDLAVGAWEGVKNAIVDPIVSAAETIGRVIGGIIQFFKDLPRNIGEGLGQLGRVIGDVFKGALNVAIEIINWFIDRANDAILNINRVNPFENIPYINKIGKLHTGGTVPGAPGSESMWILEAGERVLPADWETDYKPPTVEPTYSGMADRFAGTSDNYTAPGGTPYGGAGGRVELVPTGGSGALAELLNALIADGQLEARFR
jgi:phage-related protein